ncbi:Lrp/AsnC ligand binding domain-containing protein [Parvicella tangerina]|uniref:Regulatory protein AsnC n=1 Tax=Parvicella tangerina TaxID=2829795 RepID=A0A916JKL5_9FLAO|nr:Lrp/AsnC ligand binding domain-containing protein [Parvicella tangerina]CAG5077779.1 Regulatory protein AsnC [Parvicella tangerina]
MYQKYDVHYEIDDLDRAILNILIKDAKTPYTEIASQLIVSPGTIHVRMKKLESLGIVTKSTLIVDPVKLGYDMTAFLGVYLEHGSDYEQVVEELKDIPEVVEAYFTTGEYSIFLKIHCRNTQHLYDLLNHKIQSIKTVVRTDTLISLAESIKRQIKV